MRGFFSIIALLCATAGASYSPNRNPDASKDLLTSTEATTILPTKELEISSTSAVSNSNAAVLDGSTISNLQETSSIATNNLAEDEAEILATLPPTAQQPLRRRIITYDQRQEGQYNVRADLDNFMFILVPQSPSILSEMFLTRSHSRHPSKSKEKLANKNSYNVPSYLKLFESSKKFPNSEFNFRPAIPINELPILQGQKQAQVAIIDRHGDHTRRLPEFVEGRTPYHVDISANDDENSRLHPNLQVDVLPPPYPLAYQHLKPYHLEAEPTVIQALPPSELQTSHVSDKFLETYNQLLTSGLKNAASSDTGLRARHNNDGPELGYYRISRSIRNGNNALDSDNANSLNSHSIIHGPIYRSEHSLGASSLYPPIDVPNTFGYFTERRTPEFEESTDDVRDQVLDTDPAVGRAMLPILDITVPQDDVELELHGVSLIDRAAKTLLSDGLERCAPGYRRDSYGLCREIEGY